MEDAYESGKIRAIGLSNFNSVQIDKVLKNSHIKPVIDQIETHLFWQQAKMHPYLLEHDMVHESWAPLGENFGREMMNLPEIKSLAEKYQVSSAQILLRWLTQQKIVTIPKSTNLDHIKSNFESINFKLNDEEIDSLRKFDRHHSIKDWPESMRETSY